MASITRGRCGLTHSKLSARRELRSQSARSKATNTRAVAVAVVLPRGYSATAKPSQANLFIIITLSSDLSLSLSLSGDLCHEPLCGYSLAAPRDMAPHWILGSAARPPACRSTNFLYTHLSRIRGIGEAPTRELLQTPLVMRPPEPPEPLKPITTTDTRRSLTHELSPTGASLTRERTSPPHVVLCVAICSCVCVCVLPQYSVWFVFRARERTPPTCERAGERHK